MGLWLPLGKHIQMSKTHGFRWTLIYKWWVFHIDVNIQRHCVFGGHQPYTSHVANGFFDLGSCYMARHSSWFDYNNPWNIPLVSTCKGVGWDILCFLCFMEVDTSLQTSCLFQMVSERAFSPQNPWSSWRAPLAARHVWWPKNGMSCKENTQIVPFISLVPHKSSSILTNYLVLLMNPHKSLIYIFIRIYIYISLYTYINILYIYKALQIPTDFHRWLWIPFPPLRPVFGSDAEVEAAYRGGVHVETLGTPKYVWLVVWNHGILWLSIHLGISSSQLTKSYYSEG